MPDWTVVIPVKGTPSAKSRLGASSQLALAIALDSVEAAVGAARVVVVTSAALAGEFGAIGASTVVDEAVGLNAAVAQGIAAAREAREGQTGGPSPVAVLLGDVPALRPQELIAALELAEHHPLSFVPDADNDGTVLIAALNPAAHRPAFGAHSRAAHLAAGYVELGIPLDSGLRRDVDTAAQLAELSSRTGPRTRGFARTSTPPARKTAI